MESVHSADELESVLSRLNNNLDDDVDSGRAARDDFTIHPQLAAIKLTKDGSAAAVAGSSTGSPSHVPVTSLGDKVHLKEHPVAVEDYSIYGGHLNC